MTVIAGLSRPALILTHEPFIKFSTPGPVDEGSGRVALLGAWCSAQHSYEWTSTHWKDSHEHCEALK